MQRRLIYNRANYERIATAFSRKGKALKRNSPPIIKVSLDANFIKSRLVMILVILRCCVCFTHSAPPAFSSCEGSLWDS